MKRFRMISDGALLRLRQGAVEAWQRQDYPQYFKIMEQASRQDPANPAILLDMGGAYGKRYDFAAAERCFEKAVRVSPNREDTLVMAGTHCRAFDHYEMARAYFERAIKEPKVSPDACAKLAEIYERFRLLEEAGELVDRALRLDPACALASLVRARLDRLSGKPEEAERRLRPLLAQSARETWSTRIRGWYELGAVLDGQGRYDEAMAAFCEAKAMILPNAGPLIAAQKQVHANLKLAAERLKPGTGPELEGPRRLPRIPRADSGCCAGTLVPARRCSNRSWTCTPTASPWRRAPFSCAKPSCLWGAACHRKPSCSRYWNQLRPRLCGRPGRLMRPASSGFSATRWTAERGLEDGSVSGIHHPQVHGVLDIVKLGHRSGRRH